MSEPQQDERDERREAAEKDEGAAAPAEAAEPAPEPTAELEAETPTVRRPPVEATAPRPAAEGADAARLRDVTGTLASYLRGRAALVADLARRHRGVSAALALLACVAAALLGLALMHATAVPDEATIVADARSLLEAPTCSGGTYGTDATLVAQGVDVRSVTRSSTAPEGTSPQFGASGYATAEVVASYAGQGVTADQGATLSYALVDGTWTVLPEVTNEGVTWRATQGVSQDKVLSNVHLLLARADEADDGEPALADLYAGSETSIEDETFDEAAQTDVLEIVCSRSGAFEAYECRLAVTFSFSPDERAVGRRAGRGGRGRAGAQPRRAARNLGGRVPESADRRRQVPGRARCRSHGGGARLELRRRGRHAVRHRERPCALSRQPRGRRRGPATGTRRSRAWGSRPGSRRRTRAVSCSWPSLPEDVGGTVTLTLRFGTEQDPSAVTAEVLTEFAYDDAILFIPYERTASYTDLFALTRADG